MFFAPAGRIMEQNDGRPGCTMAAIIRHHGPEVAALCGFSARVQHRCPGFIDKDAVRAAQMGFHVIDDRHQVETGAADPVAERAPVQIDPLPLEDLGLAVEWQVVAELGDDDPGDEQFGGQSAGHDMLGGMRLNHNLRAAAAGILGPPRDQHPELGRDHVQTLGHVLSDLRHLAAPTGTLRAGRLDHPFDPRQVGRQMAAIARGLAGRFPSGPLQRRLGLLLSSLKHTLGQFGIFQSQVELVGRQLLGAFAEPLALRCAQDILQPTIGLLHLGERRLDLGQASFQMGILTGKNS